MPQRSKVKHKRFWLGIGRYGGVEQIMQGSEAAYIFDNYFFR